MDGPAQLLALGALKTPDEALWATKHGMRCSGGGMRRL